MLYHTIFRISICFTVTLLSALLTQSTALSAETTITTTSGVRIQFEGDRTYRVALDGQTFSDPIAQQPDILLRNRQFDPLTSSDLTINEPDDAPQARSADGSAAWLVQFETLPLDTYRDEIAELGGVVSRYVPDQTLIVLMNDKVRESVNELDYVRWVGPYRAEYKLDQTMGIERAVRSGQTMPTRYSIMLLARGAAMQDTIAAYIESLGGTIDMSNPQGMRVEATMSPAQLAEVARHPAVLFIDLWSQAESDVDITRTAGGVNYIEAVAGYTGAGVRAEVMDDGLYTQHEQFQARPPLIRDNDTRDNDHGTDVYGILFGSGDGNLQARGLLPDAQGIFSSHNNSGRNNRYAHTAALVDPNGPYRAVFQTNSWGDARTTQYTTISSEFDDIIFQNDIVILQSQSNAGDQMSRPQAWAKNVVSVGAYHHNDNLDPSDDMWDDGSGYVASIGPASDGRIKPDLSFFIDNIYTTSENGGYNDNFGGTSSATPLTAGHFGVFFQMWADGVFEGSLTDLTLGDDIVSSAVGLNRDVFDSRPHATTTRALMINTATQKQFSGRNADMTRVHQGWGTASVRNAFDLAIGENMPILLDEGAVLRPFGEHKYAVSVLDNCPLKATMVYADPAGNPSASIHRVNDLTLQLISPSGTTYWGNNGLDLGNWSTSGGNPNNVDTVENVFIQTPEYGQWLVRVSADSIVEDAHMETTMTDANYSLVVTRNCSEAESALNNTPPPPGSGDGVIVHEWWNNIPGGLLSDLENDPSFPEFPSGVGTLNSFEAPTDRGDDYGQRIRGCIVAPIDGAYKFWVASDDQAELRVSIYYYPDEARTVAEVPSWTGEQEWSKYPGQESAPVLLEEGAWYYIDATMKESRGGDHLAVAWQVPGYGRLVIPAEHISTCPDPNGLGDSILPTSTPIPTELPATPIPTPTPLPSDSGNFQTGSSDALGDSAPVEPDPLSVAVQSQNVGRPLSILTVVVTAALGMMTLVAIVRQEEQKGELPVKL